MNDKMTLEELRFQYEEYQKEKAMQKHYQTRKEEGFFGRFQVNPELKEPLDVHPSIKIFDQYVATMTHKVHAEIKQLEDKIAYHRFLLNHERKLTIERSVSTHYESNPITRYHVDQIAKLQQEKEDMVHQNPIAWLYHYEQIVLNDLYNMEKKRMVEVPYVQNAKRKIIDALQGGTPVYLVGHLGSGKTQLAVEAAVDFTIENRIQKELEDGLEEWFHKNPKATDQEAFRQFVKLHDQRRAYYNDLIEHGSHKELEQIQPLFISGSHNLTYEDMFVEKTLTLSKGFEEEDLTAYLDGVTKKYQEWVSEHEEVLETMKEEERRSLEEQVFSTISDLMIAKNSSFGTTVEKMEREILVAIKQGRPVIIDELNTIAMQNLIALNDILQHRAGSKAYVTGVGPVTIQPGFALIGTGNLSTDTVQYEGTNRLNPAFQSRFITVEYNYVHENMIGSLNEETNMEENELFRLIVEYLLEEDGSLFLPDIEHTLEELFHFASLASLSQQVFMGRWNEKAQIDLKEAVLSIRNILHVLDHYNHGENEDLSMALWNGFLSSITSGPEQNYLLNQAVRFGFYKEEDGWKIPSLGIQAAPLTLSEIRTRPYRYVRSEIECYSRIDVVHLLFGEGLDFDALPKELAELFTKETMSFIEKEEIQSAILELRHFQHTMDIVDVLDSQLSLGLKNEPLVDSFLQNVRQLEIDLEEYKQTGNVKQDLMEHLNSLQDMEKQVLELLVPHACHYHPLATQVAFLDHPYNVYERNDRLILDGALKEVGDLLYNKLLWFRKARGSSFQCYCEIGNRSFEGYKDGRLVQKIPNEKDLEISFDKGVSALSRLDETSLLVGLTSGDVYRVSFDFTKKKHLASYSKGIVQLAGNEDFIAAVLEDDILYILEKHKDGFEPLPISFVNCSVEQLAALNEHDFVYVDKRHRLTQLHLSRITNGEELWQRPLY